jgi:ATP-binding cassette subfamily B multidrug efflux pump
MTDATAIQHDALDVLSAGTISKQNKESGLHDLKLLAKLWPYLKRYKVALAASVVLLPLLSGLEVGQTFLIRYAIDGPIRHGNWPLLLQYAAAYPVLLFLNFALRYQQMALSQKTGQNIIRDLRVELYSHFQILSPNFYHRHPQGKLLTRLTGDIENLNEMLSSGGLVLLADLAMVIGAFIGMLLMNWTLALVTIVTMAILLCLMDFFRQRSRRAYDEIRVQAARQNGFLQESLNGVELVQLYRREKASQRHFDKLNSRTLKLGRDAIFYSTGFNAVVDFMTTITLALVLAFGSFQARAGLLSIGALVGFFLFVRKMFEPIEDISEKYNVLQSGLASIDKVMALLVREQPEILSPEMPDIPATVRARGALKLENLSFAYQPGRPILHEINLDIRPGETIALVGPSGAGKSTLLKLLMRFYDVSEGALTLDGVDVRRWDLTALRRNIVSIQQDDFLFSRTVAENIALRPAASLQTPEARAWLYAALRKSHSEAVVSRFPNGLDEVLQERGQNLSAGERQLLLFARAMAHDPAILILDEATSAVDPLNERLIQEAMTDLMRERTVLLVAHRLSTVREADRILVMDKGRIIQQGRHEELIGQAGLYQDLCHYQDLLSNASLGE